MTPPAKPMTSCENVAALLHEEAVLSLLREQVQFDDPNHRELRKVRIERFWPIGEEGAAFEWSFEAGSGGRQTLFGSTPALANTNGCLTAQDSARVTPAGASGVFAQVPEWDLTIHSIDRDPRLPHLQQCLDPVGMKESLVPILVRSGWQSTWSSGDVRCELLGYRAGRRAAIRYMPGASKGTAASLVGKTYRSRRGERLLRVHQELNRQLCQIDRGRVRVPSPVAYVRDRQLALFAWTPGRMAFDHPQSIPQDALTAIEALTALHQVTMKQSRIFSLEDELAIVKRWDRTLRWCRSDLAGLTEPLVQALLEASESLDETRTCTIHRDFYEMQIRFTARTTTLLDFDTLAQGSPCVDVGNFLAHLFLQLLTLNRSQSEFLSLSRAVTKGYEDRMGALDAPLLRFYFASALFRLGAVHVRRTKTGAYAKPMWRYAHRLFKEGDRCL